MRNEVTVEDGLIDESNPSKTTAAAPLAGPRDRLPTLAVSVSTEHTDEKDPRRRHHRNVASTNQPHTLNVLPSTSNLLQVPSSSSIIPATPSLPSLPPSSRPASVSQKPAHSALTKTLSHDTNAGDSSKQDTSIPLGLKEVMENYKKEYLGQLMKVLKLNIIPLFIGTVLILGGMGMMVYSAIIIMAELKEEYSQHGSAALESSTIVAVFQRLGAVLAGIGAFIDMVSVVYILDKRAIFDRECHEKIDEYKKNRQQPRNIFEILLANANRRNQATAPSVSVEPEAAGEHKDAHEEKKATEAAAHPTVSALVKSAIHPGEEPRRPSFSSQRTTASRPRRGSVAAAMAKVTSQQLKEFSKAKGDDVDVYVMVSHPTQRPLSRASMTSSIRKQQTAINELPEGAALQVHKSLDEWLNTSVQHTVTNEFATEADNESDTLSIAIETDKDKNTAKDDNSLPSAGPTPEPTIQDIANPTGVLPEKDLTRKKVKKPKHPRVLPGSNVPIGSVFQQMYAAQKTATLYDLGVERETPLPPPVRASAHYARRQQLQQMYQQQQLRRENTDVIGSSPWAAHRHISTPQYNTNAFDQLQIHTDNPTLHELPPLPPVSTNNGKSNNNNSNSSKPPLPRNVSTNKSRLPVGANIRSNNKNNNIEASHGKSERPTNMAAK